MSQHDIDPLDDELAHLLEMERRRPGAPRTVRGRVLARVHATVAIAGLGSAGGGGAPPGDAVGAGAGAGGAAGLGAAAGAGAVAGGAAGVGAAAAAGGGGAVGGSLLGGILSKPILMGLGVLALGGAVTAGVTQMALPDPAPVASSVATPAPPPPGALLPGGDPAPPDEPQGTGAEEPIPPPPPVRASERPRPSSEAGLPRRQRDADLAAERAILEEARRAVASGRSGAAFVALQRHAQDFPRGRLSEEREALWIQALISAGRTEEARQRAGRFRRAYPRSMLLPAFEAALGTIP